MTNTEITIAIRAACGYAEELAALIGGIRGAGARELSARELSGFVMDLRACAGDADYIREAVTAIRAA